MPFWLVAMIAMLSSLGVLGNILFTTEYLYKIKKDNQNIEQVKLAMFDARWHFSASNILLLFSLMLWFLLGTSSVDVPKDTYLVKSITNNSVDYLDTKQSGWINLNEKQKSDFEEGTVFKVTEYTSAYGIDWSGAIKYEVYKPQEIPMWEPEPEIP
jgi:hypothetical protein